MEGREYIEKQWLKNIGIETMKSETREFMNQGAHSQQWCLKTLGLPQILSHHFTHYKNILYRARAALHYCRISKMAIFKLMLAIYNSNISTALSHLAMVTMPFFCSVFFLCVFTILWLSSTPGGYAWGTWMFRRSTTSAIPGPRGIPLLGSLLEMRQGELPHVQFAHLTTQNPSWGRLMALSFGRTRVVLTADPSIAREILLSPAFSDRPIKQSARELLFHRAIGFAPCGDYWRLLRRVAASHLFSPRRMAAHSQQRELETCSMLDAIAETQSYVCIRKFLRRASVNIVMRSVFGKAYNFRDGEDEEAEKVQRMIREGFELLAELNWSDHLPPWLVFVFTLCGAGSLSRRCRALAAEVRVFVQDIIDEHRRRRADVPGDRGVRVLDENADYVDVLLSISEDVDEAQQKLTDGDMVAVLWEMIFRGTDTTAILMEWILAELVLHPEAQQRIQFELDLAVPRDSHVKDADLSKLPYMQAVIKECLRLHLPGPLLSWARLSTSDATVAGHVVPAGTTAMVNMWAITHDPSIWPDPSQFRPERFLACHGGADVDVRGTDLRLAAFGAGRRVCPGRALGYSVVQLWTANLLHRFSWSPHRLQPVDLSELLTLSCEMKYPLVACATPRF